MTCRKRLWRKLGRRCGSDYFAASPCGQTAPDGRFNIMANDHRFPWVWHLTCLSCGARYVIADRQRSGKVLYDADSKAARGFLDQDRQHFGQSFDRNKRDKEVHVEL